MPTHDDIFAGRMLGTYFNGWDKFLRIFDYYSGMRNANTGQPEPNAWKFKPLSFSIHGGPLYGEYELSSYCQQLWKGLEPKSKSKEDYYVLKTFSPIHFRVELPARHAERVQKAFERLKPEHPQTFSSEDLVKVSCG